MYNICNLDIKLVTFMIWFVCEALKGNATCFMSCEYRSVLIASTK